MFVFVLCCVIVAVVVVVVLRKISCIYYEHLEVVILLRWCCCCCCCYRMDGDKTNSLSGSATLASNHSPAVSGASFAVSSQSAASNFAHSTANPGSHVPASSVTASNISTPQRDQSAFLAHKMAMSSSKV